MNREIKFREPITDQWGMKIGYHYWGIIDGKYVPPRNEYNISAGESEEFTGVKDKNGVDIYENDNVINGNGKEREVGYNERRCQFGVYSRQLNCWITNELLTNDEWEVAGTSHE